MRWRACSPLLCQWFFRKRDPSSIYRGDRYPESEFRDRDDEDSPFRDPDTDASDRETDC